ncbi:zinc-binding protein A33-like [Cyprinodon tularosa]|uniref:zinc-binding protein A33-like n=1 Tax=Cyprinodon variegatus TaxID=28743 RepID=UPI0007424F6F|nr:PREDICTED: zinc-binding protein A33-like [Cyprinodon variegatus]XP_038148718.1 zinc-binding protein A33-like [Cyprinodon tularosa]
MAESIIFQSYLSCPVCSNTLKDPVSLSCSHNFCASCLQRFWHETKTKNCPICRRRSSKERLSLNYTLKELADSFARTQVFGPPGMARREENLLVVCNRHPEDPKYYCKDEQRAVCHICEFILHQNHKVLPIEQAINELKMQLKSDLRTLQDKRNWSMQMEKTYSEMGEHLRIQVLNTESQIRAEFNKLHQFLKEEEESRLAALRLEEEQKAKTMSSYLMKIQEQISSLTDTISALEEDLQKEVMPFLSSYKATQSRARTHRSVPNPQLFPGALIDVPKHLGNLSYRVWEKMKEKAHFSPIVLDPNTAHPSLYLSDDLTSVKCGVTWQQLPDNPERNIKYANVFGSEGFSSGKHSWEVKVGDHPDWLIGLVKESFDRKGETFASPKFGVLCLVHRNGKYSNGAGKTVMVRESLQRIRILLDYDGGEVSFYNCEDRSLLCTHKDTFSEKLLPYFCIGKAGESKTHDIRISKISP